MANYYQVPYLEISILDNIGMDNLVEILQKKWRELRQKGSSFY
jgi:hypothetical protein